MKGKTWQQKAAIGGGLLAVIGAVVFVALLGWALSRERASSQYPGSAQVSAHSNYSGLPFEFRWDDSYQTSDGFNRVYNWYSVTYDLGAEARANGQCILLQGAKPTWLLTRYFNVLLCGTPRGQMVFVSRTMTASWRWSMIPTAQELQALFTLRALPANR